uniref:plexin-C1 isoform X2 n=1 Tax=Scatophagus argus TaxID=75038 RepID=UPI001ED848EA|nr:plexin-C1 isoform X2 [Scatophagus argus]
MSHRCKKMILLPGLLLLLWGEPSRCLEEERVFEFNGALRQFAVATNTVYIATEDELYQLKHDLTLIQSLTQRGTLNAASRVDDQKFSRVSETDKWNATLSVNILLPFVVNETLISCGVVDNGCGYCELLDLKDISAVLYREHIQVGPPWRNSASVGFLVSVEKSSIETYIVAASQHHSNPPETSCSSRSDTVNLHNTNDKQRGLIFSSAGESSSVAINSADDINVEFVDGFQIDLIIYLFANLPSNDKSNKVRLIWLEGKGGKTATLQSLRGATLSISDGGKDSRLLASSAIPGGPPVLWSGVFSVDGGQTNTELVLFDISPDLTGDKDADPDFHSVPRSNKGKQTPKTLKPKKVLFKQNYMTSVLAVRQKGWVVFFIGTGDGQLIKLAVDKNYHTTCPMVLYRANDDRRVFPKIHLDQVDRKYVYVPFQNQMKRVPVSKCSTYTNVQHCWSAQDPYCVWCSSTRSCMFEDDCQDSNWLSIPDDFQQKMVSYKLVKDSTDQITLTIQTHLTVGQDALSNFFCQFLQNSRELCRRDSPPPQFPHCKCILINNTLPDEGLHVKVKIGLGMTQLFKQLKISNCADIKGPPTAALCRQCIEAGCLWSKNSCSWADQGERKDSVCQMMESRMNVSGPEIFSISPSVVSFYGRNHAVLSGRNLHSVTRVRIQGDMDCKPQELNVWSNTGVNLTFHIPRADSKGVVKVCVLLADGSCHGNAKITYQSSPSCTYIAPSSTWASGKRKITLVGSHLEFVEGIIHSPAWQEVSLPRNNNYQNLTYDTPAMGTVENFKSNVFLKVANETLICPMTITYYPEPEFTSFATTRTGDDVRITIQKMADKLNMTIAELSVLGIHEGKPYPCIMEAKETSNETDSFICEIQMTPHAEFQQLKIIYGDKTVTLTLKSSSLFLLMLLVLLLIPCIIGLVVIIYRRKQQQLTAQMNKRMEDLELDIRNDIRQGFVDLQTEKADLMENVGTIPFLDYKHFASRIFFPEGESLMTSCIKDISQDAMQVQLDECCQGLSRLIEDQFFLTSMVHALEEQKNFTIKDKCVLASLLTVALHNNLTYLTEVMEALLKDLMQQNSNTQPKLLLRRTESIVEKLLTNWMSVCLYGFLRESVGQHLFLMVSALTQQTAKGPVDCVTEKALYTLSEDWLLWQAPEFSSLKLKVLFAVGSDGEVSEPLEVSALSCDTVEQVKEKILSTFKAKFGFPYNTILSDICIGKQQKSLVIPVSFNTVTKESTH